MIQGKLPLPWTEFVGRARERTSLQRLLGRARLVTVLGLSGVGKSRLARRVVEDLLPEFAGQVWFIQCEGLESTAGIIPVIRRAAGLPVSAATHWEELFPSLADCRALLVLDTAECLLGAGLREMLPSLLQHAPGISVLLTSLEPAGLEGEHLFPLRPMTPPSLDGLDATAAADQWRQYDGVRLFESRALQRDCDWQLTPANLPTVVSLCQEMDWLPLGIELAAGQLSPWSEGQLLDQIRQRGRQLDLTATGGVERHASLRRAIAWSWSLLPLAERELVMMLAALGGQAFEEALEPLTNDPQAPLRAALLFRKGILQAEQRAGRLRYLLPQTVQSFALEQEPAAEVDLARAASFCLDLARTEGDRLRTPAAAAAAAALRLEMPLLQRCWQWAREQEQGELLFGFAAALWTPLLHELELPPEAAALATAAMAAASGAEGPVAAQLAWIAGATAARLGHLEEAAARLRRCLEADGPELVQALTLKELGQLQLQQGQSLAGRDSLQQSVAALDRLGREEEAAWARRALASAHERLGDRSAAERLLEEAGLQFSELELPTGQARVCVDLASLAADEERWETAEARGQEGARHHHELGHEGGLAGALLQLARVRSGSGDLEEGRRLYREALRGLRSAGSVVDICRGLLQAAVEPRAVVRPIEPSKAYRECIALSRERGMRSVLAHALRGLAHTYATDGRTERALSLAREAVQVARETTETPLIQACLDLLGQIEKIPSAATLVRAPDALSPGPIRVESVTVRELETPRSSSPEEGRRTTITARTVRGRASNWPPVTPAGPLPAGATGPMRVRLLGGMTIFVGEAEVPLLDWWAKAKKLFAYLVIHRNRPISRDVLLEEFWPEGDQQRAIHSLQTTLSFLRRSLRSLPGGHGLADRLIIARDGNYLFDSEGRCESDLQLFEYHWQEGARLKAAGQPDAAAAHWSDGDCLYVGDLLPDFPYEDWCASPRERLRSQYLELLLDLARYQRQAQKPQDALRTTERMFLIDSCDERAHRMAMRCHVQLGRPVDALRQFERCCQVLERELRVQPSKATRDLHELIRQRMSTSREARPGDGHGESLSAGING